MPLTHTHTTTDLDDTELAIGSLVDDIADLARRAVTNDEAAWINPDELDGSLFVRTTRDDERLHTVDLENHLAQPRRARGTATLYDPMAFCTYVNRLANAHTTIWATQTRRTLTAVFNDHNSDTPGWRDHTAVLKLTSDDDWLTWIGENNNLRSQAGFAEHLENVAHTVIKPDAATMLEVATNFQAHRTSTFTQGTRLASGDVQLTWLEQTDVKAGTKGHLEVPNEFTIAVAPFSGGTAHELTARLRYRIQGGELRIGYRLHRPDMAEQAAFGDITRTIEQGVKLADGTPIPVLIGEAPVYRSDLAAPSTRMTNTWVTLSNAVA